MNKWGAGLRPEPVKRATDLLPGTPLATAHLHAHAHPHAALPDARARHSGATHTPVPEPSPVPVPLAPMQHPGTMASQADDLEVSMYMGPHEHGNQGPHQAAVIDIGPGDTTHPGHAYFNDTLDLSLEGVGQGSSNRGVGQSSSNGGVAQGAGGGTWTPSARSTTSTRLDTSLDASLNTSLDTSLDTSLVSTNAADATRARPTPQVGDLGVHRACLCAVGLKYIDVVSLASLGHTAGL